MKGGWDSGKGGRGGSGSGSWYRVGGVEGGACGLLGEVGTWYWFESIGYSIFDRGIGVFSLARKFRPRFDALSKMDLCVPFNNVSQKQI